MRIINIGWNVKGFHRFIKLGQRFKLSPEAEYRLKVIAYYFNKFKKNASKTGRYFGLHRNSVSKYIKLYNPNNLHLLEPKSKAPIKCYRKKTSEWIIDLIIKIKKEHPYLGKIKVYTILLRDHGISVSASTIGRVFKNYKLTYLWRNNESACNFKKTIRKRKSRKRPPKVFYSNRPGKWIQIDTIKFGFGGKYVYVINAVDLCSRLAISFAYTTPSSKNARDFLFKLQKFFPCEFSIEMIQTDNGSEFLKYFHAELEKQKITHTFSYPKQPKMNAYAESYNKTIQLECLKRRDALLPINILNKKIAEYLIEYNSWRPHQSLGYQVPLLVYLKYWFTHHKKVHTKIWTCSLL
jgi:transposase InsO family protein